MISIKLQQKLRNNTTANTPPCFHNYYIIQNTMYIAENKRTMAEPIQPLGRTTFGNVANT